MKCAGQIYYPQRALQIHSCILLLYNSPLRDTAQSKLYGKKEEKKKDVQNETLKPITKAKFRQDKELQELEVESTKGGELYR